MKRIGLDTSAIGYCLEKNISAKDFKKFLHMRNLVPVVCTYVTYELSRTFLRNMATAKALFCFLSELEPQYIAGSETLYSRELDKLNKNGLFCDLIDEPLKNQMLRMIEAHAAGNITEDLTIFINGRQTSLDSARHKNFQPSTAEKMKINGYKSSSQVIEALFSRLKAGDVTVTKCFQDIILTATSNKVQLSDEHILKLVQNIFDYKALRSLIRNTFHLHFLTHKHSRHTPNENRFTDGLVMIEYSYCDQFLGHDAALVREHAQAINPDISPINVSEFLKDLVPLPDQNK